MLGESGFLGLPGGDRFCIVRAKDGSLLLSHTSLGQLRKRLSGLVLDEL